MVINHLGKLFVTHDAATIVKELEVEHPAAKLLVYACKAMEEEIGDATNLVIVFAGELLNLAEQLIRMGIHSSHVIQGYTQSSEAALKILPELIVKKLENVKDVAAVSAAIKTSIGSKQPSFAGHLAKLTAEACIAVCPENAQSFNVDNVRIAKLEGGSVSDSCLIHGFVIARDTEGTIKDLSGGVKVAVYNCAVDSSATDTKGKVDISTADQLKNFSKTEELQMEKVIGSIAKAGVKVIVSSQSFGDLALHFIERHGLMAVKVQSKFELRRLTQAVNAVQIMTLDAPTPEEMGRCDKVYVDEIGGQKITIFEQLNETAKLATIIVRGPTQNILNDLERAIDDGVNSYKSLCRDQGLVAGGGACEIELARRLTTVAEETPDMHQYAMRKYAQAFEVIPTTLAEVSGHNATNVITSLMADHQKGLVNNGVDIEEGSTKDMVAAGILDLYLAKHWAIKLATDAAITVLRVDQIIMAKQAGGPKQRDQGPHDDD
eukprot:NODE_1872_length_1772_cov_63.887811_g1590_i0.p1 GENE.NODE_1872_length_1772_cov_63.887811_g1590_i0~~NODE_1872_length_1772_cov_63.887811_g1590_i0.p1  ORF type:complete len:561 (-),score=116.08 NODE_1872_length_1772_cov_63.887811_g1590_i0:88-1560(-)